MALRRKIMGDEIYEQRETGYFKKFFRSRAHGARYSKSEIIVYGNVHIH